MDKKGIVKIRRFHGMTMVSERHTDFKPLTVPLTDKEQAKRIKRVRYIIREASGWVIGLAIACSAIIAIHYLNIGYIQALIWVSKSFDRLTSWAGVLLGL